MPRSSTDGSTAGIIVLAAGVFDLFLAVVFAVLIFLVPDARVAMAITAAVLGVSGVGAVVIGLRLRARGVAEEVAPAPAAMSFEPPPGAVPTYPPAYAPAAAMGDPETLAAVQAAVQQVGAQAGPVFAAGEQSGYTVEQLRAYLRQYGIQGSARIDRLEDTGRIVGDERVFTTTVTVDVPGRPSRVDGPSATMIPLVALHKVAVGKTVPILVAPDNPHLLMFEWDRT
jgi:hypothetical protein